MIRRHTRALFALSVALASSAVLANDDATTHEPEPAKSSEANTSKAPVPATANSLRAVRDEKTGKLRAPNRKELEEMEAAEAAASPAAAARSAEPVAVRGSTGVLAAQLGPEYLISLKGERTGDGNVERSHETVEQDKTVPAETLPTE